MSPSSHPSPTHTGALTLMPPTPPPGTPHPAPAETTRDLLAKAGYDIRFRREQWVECFASRGPERWRGCGCNDDEAAEDVLRQMLPSSLARALFTQYRFTQFRTAPPGDRSEDRSPEPAAPSASDGGSP
jgi:hypothetical protein